MYYTGIGSRKTPAPWLEFMTKLAQKLAKKGLALRSGAAEGADSAFERGCLEVKGEKEIFLPWAGFGDRPTNQNGYYYTKDYNYEAYIRAKELAERFHPKWEQLSEAAKNLHTRNVHQVLGLDVRSPSKFLVCYTNEDFGGTRQAIRVAEYLKIPIFNLAIDGQSSDMLSFIRQLFS